MQYFAQNSLAVLEWAGVCRLFVAAVLGALLGLERSLAGKHAGMRTYALVAMGSCLFVIVGTLSSYQLSFFPGVNPVQIAASVVIGIGFIGSGLAAFHGGAHPVELTTAAGIWVAAGVGMALGFGFYLLPIAATLFAITTLTLLKRVETAAEKKFGRFNGNGGQNQ